MKQRDRDPARGRIPAMMHACEVASLVLGAHLGENGYVPSWGKPLTDQVCAALAAAGYPVARVHADSKPLPKLVDGTIDFAKIAEEIGR